MQKAVPVGVGAMAALLGLDIEAARAVAEAAAQGQVCDLANDNSPGQIVVSGHRGAVERAVALAAERGARTIMLPVSAPFHCSLMSPAADIMAEALAETALEAPVVPLVANVVAAATSDPEEIKHLLVAQARGNLDRADIGERHPQVFGLAARKASQEVGEAQEAGRRLTHGLAGRVGVRVGDVTQGEHLLPAEEARAAGDRERDDHAIAAAERLDVAPDLHHFAHRLVTDDIAFLHGRHEAAVEMEI